MISVVGLDGGPVSPAARSRLERAALVVGAPRHLASVVLPPGARTAPLQDDLTGTLTRALSEPGDVVVLASGDPGYFGVLRLVRALAGEREVEVLPGRSSVAAAFAAVGLRWDDAEVVSAHGRDARPALAVARRAAKVAVLTDPDCGPADVGRALLDRPDRTVVVAERLGLPDQRVTSGTPAQVADRADWLTPNVVLVVDPAAQSRPAVWRAGGLSSPTGWGLPVTAFRHRNNVVTKPEVRAVALSRLGPRPGTVVWDVGAGSGSVAVECARFGADVHAVERRTEDAALVRENARAHDVPVHVLEGAAPAALAELPDPDAVFVGGGGPAVVAACAERRPARLVVPLAQLELVAPTMAELAAHGFDGEAVLVQVSSLQPLAAGHRLVPANPVFLVSGTLR